MKLETGVFDRTGTDTMSERAFYFCLGLFICLGLAATAVAAHQAISMNYTPSWLGMIGFGLVLPIIGILIAVKSDDWPISLFGYALICIPFGIILAPVVRQYNPSIIRDVCAMTAVITGVMGFAGMSFPNVFRHLGGVLFIAFTGLLIVRIAQVFVPAWQDMTWVHWVSVAVFSLYIGYDFHRSTEVPRTVDSAVDIAVSIYLDIINLFLNLLAIFGKKD
jgi:FtsH-binding integral membrane protein